MTSSSDDLADGDDFLTHVRTTGVRESYRAALAMVQDLKTPAGARIQAARLIADIAGILGGAGDEGEKEPHEMTGTELRQYTAKLEARAAALRVSAPSSPERLSSSVFD